MKGSIAAAVVLFSVLFVGSASEPKDRNSYCMPNQACWPTEDELKTFSSGLDGEVITPSSPRYDNESLINNRRFILQPGLIVEVASAEDVVSSLGFAREHNIRVTVISTGHDYDARNSGDGTLQISLKQMKRMSVVDGEGNTAFIRVETGLTWGEVHLFLYRTRPDKIAVGGADLSVGVGGWVLGGGHSPFSSMAGLGVDSVVSFDVALADGTIISASNSENQEIFWALRGGGGGTFGVVLNITFVLHDNPGPIQLLFQSFPINDVGFQALTVFEEWLSSASSNISGYLTMVSFPPGFSWILIHRGTYEDALRVVKPLLELSPPPTIVNCTDAYCYFPYAASDTGGYSIYTFNTFLGDDNLRDGALQKAYEYITKAPPLESVRVCSGTILGGATATAVKASGATAVHPGFRNARVSLTCGPVWDYQGDFSTVIEMADDFAPSIYEFGDGKYFNEPQSNLENWQTGFWGDKETYDRLLKVKNDVDPDYLFNCHHCVGDHCLALESSVLILFFLYLCALSI